MLIPADIRLENDPTYVKDFNEESYLDGGEESLQGSCKTCKPPFTGQSGSYDTRGLWKPILFPRAVNEAITQEDLDSEGGNRINSLCILIALAFGERHIFPCFNVLVIYSQQHVNENDRNIWSLRRR